MDTNSSKSGGVEDTDAPESLPDSSATTQHVGGVADRGVPPAQEPE